MAAAVTIKNFFTRQADFNGAVEHQSGLGYNNFVIERIAFPSEAATVGSGDDANVRGRHFEDLGKSAMEIMRGLRAGPDGQLAIGILDGHRSVLLDGEMGVALKEKSVLENFISLGKAFFHIAEFQRHKFMNISLFAVFVNPWLGSRQRFLGIGNRREDFIVDINQVERFEGRKFLARDDGGDGISDVAHAINAKSLLVLADRKNSVLDRDVFAGKHEINSRVGRRARYIDFSDAGMGMRRAQQLAVRHTRQVNIVGEARLTRHLRAGIDSAARDANHAKIIAVGFWCVDRRLSRIFFIRHPFSS